MHGKTIEKLSRKQAIHWHFPGAGWHAIYFVFFLSFTEGEKWICHPFSDIRKRWCKVEFFSLSPFRKINGERGFLCRDFAPVTIYGNWPDELKLRSSDATWSVWPWITNPNSDPSKGTHLKIIATNRLYHQRLCLEAWHTNPAHALLNRDDGGLLPDNYLHLIRKKAAN